MIECGVDMNLYYLAPFLSVPAAMFAPAADMPVPDSVETPAELLPVLQNVDKLSPQEARELLQKLPVPKQCSRVLKSRLTIHSILPDFLSLGGKSGEEAATIRARILQKSPAVWLGCIFLEMADVKRVGDKAREARLVEECMRVLQGLGPESGLGVVQVLGENPFQEQKPERSEAEKQEWNRGIVTRLQTLPDAPDAQVALAMSYLYEEMGAGVDVEKAMSHALRGAVAGEFLLVDSEALRDNLRLSLARAAALKGEAALPLQVAALRQMEGEDKEVTGLASYRLSRLYHSLPENLDLVGGELERRALIEGANLGHPACLQAAAEICAQEEPEEASRLYRLAEAVKFDPQKDYLNCAHGRKAVMQVYCPGISLPDATEREVNRLFMRLVVQAKLTDYLAAFSGQEAETFKMAMQVWDMLLHGVETAPAEEEIEYLERPDTEEGDNREIVQWLKKMQHVLEESPDTKEAAEGFARGAELAEDVLRAFKNGASISDEQLALLQQLADAKIAQALYMLAWRQVKFLGAFTQESLDMMAEASERGSADASWFLYTAFWEGLYGMEPNPLTATHCYRRALSQCSADAWQRVWDGAGDDGVRRLYARIHMRHSPGGEKYSLPLDDELQAYAAAHPELQGIIAPLRLLYFRLALKADSLNAEETRELRLRALALAETVQPAVLKAADVEFWRQFAEYEYREACHEERAIAARKALPALKEGSADMALVAKHKLAYTQTGQDVTRLPADKLAGAHLVCRECDRALADFAIKSGVRSVTSLRMPVAERDYLRAHNIAAGGWEIVRE